MVMDNGRGTGDFGNIRRVAMISVHTSPLATLGEKDAGGLNVYVRELSRHLGRLGIAVDIFTRRTDPQTPDVVPADRNVRVVHVSAGPPTRLGTRHARRLAAGRVAARVVAGCGALGGAARAGEHGVRDEHEQERESHVSSGATRTAGATGEDGPVRRRLRCEAGSHAPYQDAVGASCSPGLGPRRRDGPGPSAPGDAAAGGNSRPRPG